MLIDEEVLAVVLAIILVSGVFTVSQAFLSGRVTEPFSELAILGPEMKIADYPKNVTVGEPFYLYLYVGNHEGRVMYYAVLIKLGDRSTQINDTDPADAPVIARYEFVILHDGNVTRPITLSISEPGLNRRLIFELWAFDEGSEGFKYHSRWCQLWLNATAIEGA